MAVRYVKIDGICGFCDVQIEISRQPIRLALLERFDAQASAIVRGCVLHYDLGLSVEFP